MPKQCEPVQLSVLETHFGATRPRKWPSEEELARINAAGRRDFLLALWQNNDDPVKHPAPAPYERMGYGIFSQPDGTYREELRAYLIGGL